MTRCPRLPPAEAAVWNEDWFWSTSEIEIVPTAVRSEKRSWWSWTVGSPITAASLAPWMVKVTCSPAPSSDVTAKSSSSEFRGSEILHGDAPVGDGVGIGAVGADGQVADSARGRDHRTLERGLVLVDVGDRDGTGSGQVAGCHVDVLGDVVDGRGADHGGVVGAVDGEGDLLGGAVERGQRKGVDPGVAETETRAVGDGVDVGALAAHDERAQIAAPGLQGWLERGFSLVGVGDRYGADRIKDRFSGVGDVVGVGVPITTVRYCSGCRRARSP